MNDEIDPEESEIRCKVLKHTTGKDAFVLQISEEELLPEIERYPEAVQRKLIQFFTAEFTYYPTTRAVYSGGGRIPDAKVITYFLPRSVLEAKAQHHLDQIAAQAQELAHAQEAATTGVEYSQIDQTLLAKTIRKSGGF